MQPLAQEYFAAEIQAATELYTFPLDSENSAREPTALLTDEDGEPVVWVIPNVLDDTECDQLIASGAEHGLIPNDKELSGSLRTAKRTSHYTNAALSKLLFERLEDHATLNAVKKDGMGEFWGLHSNWRVLRYDCGDGFPAHQDQMDSLQIQHEDGTKDLVMSSHTLLINLSQPGVLGGATRFYPNAKINSTTPGQYTARSIDVLIPRGWAVVFQQRNLVHAGQPVTQGIKHVAQTGVLRLLPKTKLMRPSTFQVGPGLAEASGRAPHIR